MQSLELSVDKLSHSEDTNNSHFYNTIFHESESRKFKLQAIMPIYRGAINLPWTAYKFKFPHATLSPKWTSNIWVRAQR